VGMRFFRLTDRVRKAAAAAILLAGTPSAFAWWAGPNSGKVEFSSANFSQSEGSSSDVTLNVQVRRVEGSLGECRARVSLATNRTATLDSDFAFTSGYVTWANGESSLKNFPVTIKHDWIDEPGETFELYLTEPLGTTIGTISTTVVTIGDNDGCKDKNNLPCPCGTTGCFDPNGALQFTASTYYGQEDTGSGNGTVQVQVARVNGSDGPVSVNVVTVSGGSATAGSDYQSATFPLSWAHGESAVKSVNITSYLDSLDEQDETVFIALQDPSGGAVLGSPVNAVAVLQDNDNPPSISLSSPSPVSAYEGNSGTRLVYFTASLSASSGKTITAGIDLSGTATNLDDYRVETALPLTFAPGELSKSIAVTIYGDTPYEPDETIALALGTLTNVSAGSSSSVGYTLTNDDLNPDGGCKDKNNLPCPCGTPGCTPYGVGNLSFTSVTYSGVEDTGAGGGAASVSVARSGGSTGGVSVQVAPTAGGTATPDEDYLGNSALLTWADNESGVKTANVKFHADLVDEPDETINIALINPTGGVQLFDPTTATVTIMDNDDQPTVTITGPSPGSVAEGTDTYWGSVDFTVNLSAPSLVPVNVYFTRQGTASHGGDYEISHEEVVTFAPGETSQLIQVYVEPDWYYEPDEYLTIVLSPEPENASLGSPSSASLVILNDDEIPTIQLSNFSASSVTEGGSVGYSLTVIGSTNQNVTVNLTTAGTASSGADYTAPVTPVVISPGQTNVQGTLQTIDDDLNELPETVKLQISSVQGANTEGQSATQFLQILDNDSQQPEVSISAPSNQSIPEAGGAATFTVSLSEQSGRQVTVDFTTFGTADSGSDYIIEPTGSVTFEAGETQKTIAVEAIDDFIDEGDEDLTIELQSADGAAIGSDASASCVIIDDEAPLVAIVFPLSFSEGTTATIAAELTTTASEVTTVVVATRDLGIGYAFATGELNNQATTTPLDYQATTATLVFQPGQIRAEMQLPIFDDLIYEQDEQFEVRIISAINALPTSPVTITIVNDDPAPNFKLEQSPTVPETAGQVSVRIVPDGSEPTAPVPLAVSYSGTAASGTDYLALSPGQVTYQPEPALKPELKFQIVPDSLSESSESISVTLNGHSAGSINITDVDGIKYFEIVPNEDVVVGPQRQIRFTAIGRNGLGQEVPSNPVWSRVGPGTISPAGLFVSPLSASANRVTIQVAEHGHPEITGSREIRLDLQPPRITALTIRDSDSTTNLLPGEAVSGEAVISWNLDAQPQEISGPVEYTLILDDRQEIARQSSDRATTNALEFSAQWQSTSVADGVHSVKILAADAVGNTNENQTPELSFRVQNGSVLPGDYAGTDAGIDWLLENQWRKSGQSFGSWTNYTTRTLTERIVEAAFAAEALSACDLRYVSSRANLHSGTTVSVAQAYHDAVSWLSKKWAAGEITDFVDQAIVHQVLSGAQAKRSRIVYHLGSVSPEFDRASAISSSFASAQNYASEQHDDGSYAATEESVGSRYETLMALRSAIKSKDKNLLSSILAGSGGIASIPAYLEEKRLSKGWANTTRPGDSSSNFYLTAEMTAAILSVTKTVNSLDLQQMLFPAIMDLKTSMSAPVGDAPHIYSTPVDVSAALHALALGKMSSAAPLIDASVTSGAALFLTGTQSKLDGSWNSRALDTAWAIRALRPELFIAPDSMVYDPLTQKLTAFVQNLGAVETTDTRVSAYSVNPAGLAPHERSKYLLGSARVPGVLFVNGALPVSIEIKQQDTPVRIYLMVDPEERVAEYDEANNSAMWSLPELPNLVVYAKDIKAASVNGGVPVAGTKWIVIAKVRNMGLIPVPVSNNTPIRLYAGNPLLEPNANYLMFQTLDTSPGIGTHLEAGESAEIKFEVLPERGDLQTAAIHRLYVWADPFSGRGIERGSIHESNEHDNIASKDIRVYEPGSHQFPDLRIVPEAIEPQPSHVMAGSVGKIRVRVDNVGAGPADPFNLGVSLDEFGTSTPVRINGIAAGQSAVVFVPFVPDSSTSYTVIALADTEGEIRENNKANNLAMATLVAGVGPDGEIDLGIAAPDLKVSRIGSDVKVTAAVHNLGRDIDDTENAHFMGTLEVKGSDLTVYGGPYTDEKLEINLGHGQTRITEFTLGNLPSPPVVALTYDAEITKDADPAVDADSRPDNNSTSRTFNLGHTNLRAISLNASPQAATITEISNGTTSVALTVTVANGDGSEDMDEASPVHLEIRDKATSRVLGYWNNLILPGVETGSEGTTNVFSFTLPAVDLPPGFHVLQAEIDPVGYFVETNETDNIIEVTVEVKDNAPERLLPDLEITASDVALRPVDGRLITEVTVRNAAPGLPNTFARQSPPTLLKLFSSATADPASTVPLSIAPLLVPSLVSGEEYRISVLTQLPVPADGYLWLEVDSDAVIAERSEGNNRVAKKLQAHEAPGSVTASAVFNTITVNWTPPAVAPDEYRVARYKASTGQMQRVWSFDGAVTDLLDQDTTIEEQSAYYYQVWARSQGGLWSLPIKSNIVETGATPKIISAVVDGYPLPVNPAQEFTTTVSLSSKVDIKVSYSGAGVVRLYRNFELVGEATCTNGIAVFQNVYLSDATNRFTGITLVNENLVSNWSNELIIYHQNELPDLAFQPRSSTDLLPNITCSVLYGDGASVELTNFEDIMAYANKTIRVRCYFTNPGTPITEKFNIAVYAIYNDRTVKETIQKESDEGVGIVDLVLPSSNAGPILELRVKLDDFSDLAGNDFPEGVIKEESEGNNLWVIKSATAQEDALWGNDFYLVYPYLTTYYAGSGIYDANLLPDVDSTTQAISVNYLLNGHEYPIDNGMLGSTFNLPKGREIVWKSPNYDNAPIGTPKPIMLYQGDQQFYSSKKEFLHDGCVLRFTGPQKFSMTLNRPLFWNEARSVILPADKLGSKYTVATFYTDLNASYPTFFQVFAIEDGITTVSIQQNRLGIPNMQDFVEPASIGEVVNGVYKVYLNKGETYVWKASGKFEDPTGVTIEAEGARKIGVVSGSVLCLPAPGNQAIDDSFIFVPPSDMFGSNYLLPSVPFTGNDDREGWSDENNPTPTEGFPDYTRNPNGELLDEGVAHNSFTRLLVLHNDTEVSIGSSNTSWTSTLDAGQIIEIGENALPYYWPNQTTAIPFDPDPGQNFYEQLADSSNVIRLVETSDSDKVISASKSIVPITYLTSTVNQNFSYGDGDPDFFVDPPLSAFTTAQSVPLSLSDLSEQIAQHYITVLVQSDEFTTPSIFVSGNYDALSSNSISQSTHFSNDITGVPGSWESIHVRGVYTGIKKCTIVLETHYDEFSEERFLVVIHNPDQLPISIRQLGTSDSSSYGFYGGGWITGRTASGELYPIDLEVNPGSITFPFSKVLTPEKAEVGRIEVLNNGTQDVTSTSGATLRVYKRMLVGSESVDVDILTTAIPSTGMVLMAKRQLSAIVDFSFTPTRDILGIGTEVIFSDDENQSNNHAYRSIWANSISYPEFVAGDIDADVTPGFPSAVITATVKNTNTHVNQVPVKWTVDGNGYHKEIGNGIARFTPDSVTTTTPVYKAVTTATLYLNDVPFDTDITVTAHFNPDYTITEATPDGTENDAENSTTTMFRINTVPLPNLAITAQAISESQQVGSTVDLTLSVTNDNQAELHKVPVVVNLGSVTGPEVGRAMIPVIGKGASISLSIPVTVYQEGANVYYATVNPFHVPEEASYSDNTASVEIDGFESYLPDLTVNAPWEEFLVPMEAVRGDLVSIESLITNIGRSDVETSYKVQIFDGGDNARDGIPVMESMLNAPDGAEQSYGDGKVFSGTWDTTTVSLGQHDLHLVIDSPDHLAAASLSAENTEASRAPMTAMYMADQGMRISDIPQPFAGRHWSVKIYAASSITPAPGDLIGVYDSLSGYRNTTGTIETTGTGSLLEVAGPAPVQLVVLAEDGLPLPRFSGQLPLEMTFADHQGTTETARYTTLNVVLPGNEMGQYGHGCSFWLADDGSTYHTNRTHLASSYGSVGTETLSAIDAMNDQTGTVAEADEINNRFTKSITIIEPARPNLKMQDLEKTTSAPRTGSPMNFSASVTNTGADLTTATRLRIEAAPVATSNSFEIIAPDQLILQPIYYGQVLERSFDWVPDTGGDYIIRVTADPDDDILELNPDDNAVTMTVTVSGSTSLSLVVPEVGPFASGSEVPVVATVWSDEKLSGVMTIDVVPSGSESQVGSADVSASMPFTLDGVHDFESSWNSAGRLGGQYQFRGKLSRLENGQATKGAIKAYSEPFDIADTATLVLGIQTDRYSYRPGDTVYLRMLASNISRAYLFDEVILELVITSSEQRSFLNVGPGDSRQWNTQWSSVGTSEGEYTANLYARDGETGQLLAHITTGFIIDGTGPTLVIDEPTSGSWNRWATRVAWSAAPGVMDLATSEGLAVAVPYVVDGMSTVTLGDLSSGDLVTSEGIIWVDAWARDFGGNVGPVSSVEFYVDQTSPTITQINAEVTSDGSHMVHVSGYGHDFEGSGIADILYRRTSDSAWTTASGLLANPTVDEPTRADYSFALTLDGSQFDIFVKAIDRAGNESEVTSVTVEGDLEAPQITLTSTCGTTVSGTFTITATVSDELSAIMPGSVEYNIVQDGIGDAWAPMTFVLGTSSTATYKATVDSWRYYDSEATVLVRATDMSNNNELTSLVDQNPGICQFAIDNGMPPQIPTGMTAAYISYTEVEVNWNRNMEPDFGHYELYRRSDAQAMTANDLRYSYIQNSSTETSNSLIDQVTTSTPTFYRYAMKSFDRLGNESTFSRTILIPPPDTPGNLVARGGHQQINLRWDSVSEGFVLGYNVYRATVPSQTFEKAATVYGRSTTGTIDMGRTNGTRYRYYITAFDGAYNESLRSNVVEAIAGLPSQQITSSLTVFEDRTDEASNDWDYNDVGVIIESTLYLNEADCVTTVAVKATGFMPNTQAAYGHELYLSFFNLKGTATYSGSWWDANYPSYKLAVTPGTIVSEGSGNKSVVLFADSHKDGPRNNVSGQADRIHGDVCELTFIIAQPELNHVSGFDRAPMDTWMKVKDTGAIVHIYDPDRPETSRYYGDVNQVQSISANEPLGGTFLGCGLSIPKIDWVRQGPDGQRLWREFEDFIDYARTYRSSEIKNRGWYE